MERFTREAPQNGGMEWALNQFFIKDQTTWVRGGGDSIAHEDMTLYDYIRQCCESCGDDVSRLSDDELSETLYDWLQYGTGSVEGVLAQLYMSAWAFSMLRAKLKQYEDAEYCGEPLTYDQLEDLNAEKPVWIDNTKDSLPVPEVCWAFIRIRDNGNAHFRRVGVTECISASILKDAMENGTVKIYLTEQKEEIHGF